MSPLTITRRLVAVVAVPLLFTGGFAAWALTTTGSEALNARRLTIFVAIAEQAGTLADQLQQERAAASDVLTGDSPFEQLREYQRRSGTTNGAVDRYLALREQVGGAPAGLTALLGHIDAQIARLPALRNDVREATTVAVSAVMLAYRITIADLASLRETVALADGGSAALVRHIRAGAVLSIATEFAARQQVAVVQAIAARRPSTQADQQAIVATGAGFDEAMASFSELAPATWVDWLDHSLTGRDVLDAKRLDDVVMRTPVGAVPQVDRTQWIVATTAQITQLHEVERRVDAAVRAEVGRLYQGKVRLFAGEAGVVVMALLAAVLTAVLQSRSMIRRLGRLAASARSTAFVSLPELVEKLRAIGPHAVDPEEFASQAAAPLSDRGRDEIGEVSNAFIAVHRQAIRTAADLANMRAGMSQIFVHLARRNQRLVGVLIHELDGAERGELDPDRLSTLFRLDNLATRMGRYTDNLLVVGGHTAGHVTGEHVPLEIVLRGAQSKIEQYRRIQYAMTDPRLMVSGVAVHDLMNLVAELLDNATQFSPPDTDVVVDIFMLRGHIVIRVADQGVGIPVPRLEQLNQALSSPPAIDVSAIRSMGLTVVAHVAARHGVRVVLSAGPLGGTVAEVDLLSSVCWMDDVASHRALDVSDRPAAPQPRRGALGDTTVEVPAIPSVGLGSAVQTDWAISEWVAPRMDVDSTGPPIFQDVAMRFSGFFGRTDAAPAEPATHWRGAADDGWAAAAVTATPRVARHTGTGLPQRNPMANLVPGTVPEAAGGAGAVDYRTPASVAASVAAFVRGSAHSRALREQRSADRTDASTQEP